MGAGIQQGKPSEQLQLGERADDDDVEFGIVRARLGSHVHSAAKPTTVGHGGEDGRALVDDLPVDPHAEGFGVESQNPANAAHQECGASAHPLTRRVHESSDERAHPQARDVEEIGRRDAPRVEGVRGASRVEPPGFPPRERRNGVVEARWDPERAHEVAPGAEGQHADFGTLSEVGGQQTGHDLGERAVAASDDEALDPVENGLARDPFRVARRSSAHDLEVAERVAQRRLDTSPATPGGAVAAPRVDDD